MATGLEEHLLWKLCHMSPCPQALPPKGSTESRGWTRGMEKKGGDRSVWRWHRETRFGRSRTHPDLLQKMCPAGAAGEAEPVAKEAQGRIPAPSRSTSCKPGASGCGSSSLPALGIGSQLLVLLLRINPMPWRALGFQQLAKPQQRGARCWWPPREPGAAVEKGKAASCVELVHDRQALPSSPEHR